MPRAIITPEAVRDHASSQRARAERLVRSKRELESKLSELLADLDETALREEADDLTTSMKRLESLSLSLLESAKLLDERAERGEAILDPEIGVGPRRDLGAGRAAVSNGGAIAALLALGHSASGSTQDPSPGDVSAWLQRDEPDWNLYWVDRDCFGGDPAKPDYMRRAPFLRGAPLDVILDALDLEADPASRNQPAHVTPVQITAFLRALTYRRPVVLDDVCTHGVTANEPLSIAVKDAANELLAFVPPSKAHSLERLPKITIDGDRDTEVLGEWGRTKGVTIYAKAHAKASGEELQSTVFHELVHWLHEDLASAKWQKATKRHMRARRARADGRLEAAQPVWELQADGSYREWADDEDNPMMFIKDSWHDNVHRTVLRDKISGELRSYSAVRAKRTKRYEPVEILVDAYAGRVYDDEDINDPPGCEVPTSTLEVLAKPVRLHNLWRTNEKFRETLCLTLEGLRS